MEFSGGRRMLKKGKQSGVMSCILSQNVDLIYSWMTEFFLARLVVLLYLY